MTSKTIKRAHPAMRDDIADLTTRRPVPGRDVEQIDPFLFLNHHGPQVYSPRNRGLPFGPHPHRGFETVTFILTGELAHRDSAGHESVIKEGGIQWMTAGSGLVHAEISPEEFMRKGGPLEILQLWVNLPPRLKMTPPRYIGLQRDEIPAIPTPDGKGVVNLVSGEYLGRNGAMQPLLDIFMSTVELTAGARVEFPGVAKRNVFLYVVRGSVEVAGQAVPEWHLIELGDAGDSVVIDAKSEAVLLFGHAEPIGAPVVSYGPFVMNTREEIMQAIHDYQAGKFNAIPADATRDGSGARSQFVPAIATRAPSMTRVRNVVFDFGGVLVSWRPQEIIDTFYAEQHLRDALRMHAFQHDDWLDMDRGTLDEASVVRRCAARMARPEGEVAALFEHLRAALTPIEPTVALLRELRQREGLKLYGLSNMSETIFAHLDRQHDFFKLFDGIVVSAAVKLLKPEPAIYEHLRDRFELDFAETVFIDDLERNVESARRVGLPSIQFVTTEQVRRELEPLL